MSALNSRAVRYWIATVPVALAFLGGAIFDLSRAPEVRATLETLGYPLYFATIIGVWKALGALAILAPRFERLKEWAYAGMVFDLSGAAVSHAVVGDPTGKILVPLILLGLTLASWALRPADRRLPSKAPSPRAPSLATADALAGP
jgi:hypothetical protein